MDAPRGSRLADARADRLTRIALQLAVAHTGREAAPLEHVAEEAAGHGLPPTEVAAALARLEERGEVTRRPSGWAPRLRHHAARRMEAREQAARSFFGWR